MCRYRVYYYTCGHTEVEAEPYLPCVADPENYCTPENTTDKPIALNKSTACGSTECGGPGPHTHDHSKDAPGTSWENTNSGHKGNSAAGDRLRHTVSTKMKMGSIVRSLTKKKGTTERSSPKLDNGGAGFLEDGKGGPRNGYTEIDEK